MVKMLKLNEFVAVGLCMVLLFLTFSLSVVADGYDFAESDHHTFTYEELSRTNDGSVFDPIAELDDDDDGIVPIKNIESENFFTRLAGNHTEYYIILCDDGLLLTQSVYGVQTLTYYSDGGNGHEGQTWILTGDALSGYKISHSFMMASYLTVVPNSSNTEFPVLLRSSTTANAEYQNWEVCYMSDGNALRIDAPNNANIDGKMLVVDYEYNTSSGIREVTGLRVSATEYTPIGLFDKSWYVPATSIEIEDRYIAHGSTLGYTVKKTPSNAILSNNWIEWNTTSNKISVNSSGSVYGIAPGSAVLTARDKITRVFDYCTVTVTDLAEGIYFLKSDSESPLYIDVQSSATTNASVIQSDFKDIPRQRWEVKLRNQDGTYYIRSIASTSGNHYLGVSSENSGSLPNIVLKYSTYVSELTAASCWHITDNDDGTYTLMSQSSKNANTGYVLGTKSVNAGANTALQQVSGTRTKGIKWYFSKVQASKVQCITQETDYWCWNASAKMFATHYYSNVTKSQLEVARSVLGSQFSDEELRQKGGSLLSSAMASERYADSTISVNSYEMKTYSAINLRKIIDNGHVVGMSVGYYTENKDTSSLAQSHSMLIYGYTVANDVYQYLIRDPDRNNPGRTHLRTYAELECLYHPSQTGVLDEEYYEIWDGIFVLSSVTYARQPSYVMR